MKRVKFHSIQNPVAYNTRFDNNFNCRPDDRKVLQTYFPCVDEHGDVFMEISISNSKVYVPVHKLVNLHDLLSEHIKAKHFELADNRRDAFDRQINALDEVISRMIRLATEDGLPMACKIKHFEE